MLDFVSGTFILGFRLDHFGL